MTGLLKPLNIPWRFSALILRLPTASLGISGTYSLKNYMWPPCGPLMALQLGKTKKSEVQLRYYAATLCTLQAKTSTCAAIFCMCICPAPAVKFRNHLKSPADFLPTNPGAKQKAIRLQQRAAHLGWAGQVPDKRSTFFNFQSVLESSRSKSQSYK